MVKLHRSTSWINMREHLWIMAWGFHRSVQFPVSTIPATVMRASNCFSIPSTLPALALLNTRLKTQSPGTTKVNGNLSPSTLPVDCVDYSVLSAVLRFCASQTDRAMDRNMDKLTDRRDDRLTYLLAGWPVMWMQPWPTDGWAKRPGSLVKERICTTENH